MLLTGGVNKLQPDSFNNLLEEITFSYFKKATMYEHEGSSKGFRNVFKSKK